MSPATSVTKMHAAVSMTVACIVLFLSGCSCRSHRTGGAHEPTPNVITEDIQAGIQGHIDDQTRIHGGHFPLVVDDNALQLKLVKIHTEYLATAE